MMETIDYYHIYFMNVMGISEILCNAEYDRHLKKKTKIEKKKHTHTSIRIELFFITLIVF